MFLMINAKGRSNCLRAVRTILALIILFDLIVCYNNQIEIRDKITIK